MRKKHGDDEADAAAVFMATHTAEAPDGSGPQWVNPYYQTLYEEYDRRARDEAIEEGSMEPESTERPAFREKLWAAIVLRDKQPKGDRLPGFGGHGAGYFNMPFRSPTTQYFSSSSSGSQHVDQEAFDDRVQREVQRQVEQMQSQMQSQVQAEVQTQVQAQVQTQVQSILEEQFEQRMQQYLATMNLQPHQPNSGGNASDSSFGQYLRRSGGSGSGSARGRGR